MTDALVEMMGDLPQALRRSLTWDQGVEMAEHARFSVVTKCPVFSVILIRRGSVGRMRIRMDWSGFFPKGTTLLK